MLRTASSEDVPQFAHSVRRDVDRGGLLKQRIVSGVLEDRSDAGVIVDRAGGGDAAGVGRTDDGIAAQRAIAQRPVESVVRVDTDIVDAAPVLSTELRGGYGGARKRTKTLRGFRRRARITCVA